MAGRLAGGVSLKTAASPARPACLPVCAWFWFTCRWRDHQSCARSPFIVRKRAARSSSSSACRGRRLAATNFIALRPAGRPAGRSGERQRDLRSSRVQTSRLAPPPRARGRPRARAQVAGTARQLSGRLSSGLFRADSSRQRETSARRARSEWTRERPLEAWAPARRDRKWRVEWPAPAWTGLARAR